MDTPATFDSADACGCTVAETRSRKRYQAEVGVATLGYVALTLLSVNVVDRFSGPAKVAVALLPMAGIAAIAVAMVRFATRMDELQRRTFIEAGAVAGLACAVVTMALGFLENAGLPRLSMIWVWPMTALAFGIAYPFAHRRYR